MGVAIRRSYWWWPIDAISGATGDSAMSTSDVLWFCDWNISYTCTCIHMYMPSYIHPTCMCTLPYIQDILNTSLIYLSLIYLPYISYSRYLPYFLFVSRHNDHESFSKPNHDGVIAVPVIT